jgi:glyoxylase-like metal-dependent hydrolase (beta-lactamase superfamily II)
MIIQAFPSGPFETNAYVLACEDTRQAVFIDPAPGSAELVSTFVKQHSLVPIAIWLTHSHWDHIADTALLKESFLIPVGIHPLDAENLKRPGSDGLPCWINIPTVEPDILFEESQQLSIGKQKFRIIFTPGHTPGGVCFYCPDKNLLISGDTLFKGSIGNLSFPTAQPDLMWKSLDKLAMLPAHTKVYPGHGPSTTIGAQTWLPHAKELFSQE